MTKMCTCQAHCFSIWQDSYLFPIHFLVTKTRPTVCTTLDKKVFHGASSWCDKEWFASIRIVKGYFTICASSFIHEFARAFKIARMLSIMTIKVANAGIDDDVSSCLQAALRISTHKDSRDTYRSAVCWSHPQRRFS